MRLSNDLIYPINKIQKLNVMEGEDNSSETISATATLRHYIMEKEEEAKRTQKLSFILVFTTLVLFITYLN